MTDLYLLFLIIHVFSAMFWVGGMIFYVIVFIPVIKESGFINVKFLLLKKTALQFRKLSYPVFFLLIISGTGIFLCKGFFHQAKDLEFWKVGIGLLFGVKLSLFLLLMVSSIYHDFVTGPKTFSYLETNQLLYEKYRKMSSFFGKLNLLVSVIIAALGILISRGYAAFSF